MSDRLVALSLALVLFGCDGYQGAARPNDAAGRDAATTPDTGVDAAAPIDASTTPDTGPTSVAGTIIPLYTDPSDASWSQLVTAANAHPSVAIVAIINPNDGPTPSVDPAYTAGIASLRAAHVTVVGYVATGFFTLTILFAVQLRDAAPHVAIEQKKVLVPLPETA